LKLNRSGAAVSLLAACALVFTACSNGSNASSSAAGAGAVKVDCGGKQSLKASGSTAQANAMTQFVGAFQKACAGQTVNYTPNGSGAGVGAKGNEGTAAAVKNTEGAITYNEWSFAQAQNLYWAKIVTPASPDPVNISTESAGKTIAGAKVNVGGNDLVLDTSSFYKPTQAGAYPIVLATYEIVCSKYPDADVGKAVKAFLQATIGAGQAGLGGHGYVPLPAAFQSKVSTAVNAVA
jgi:phosphate transport system substrate-binding protein